MFLCMNLFYSFYNKISKLDCHVMIKQGGVCYYTNGVFIPRSYKSRLSSVAVLLLNVKVLWGGGGGGKGKVLYRMAISAY